MPNNMSQLLGLARSGVMARLFDLDVVSNNLANVNTFGYKGARANFQELLTNASEQGTLPRGTQMLLQQGALRTTGNALDVAIQGEGFFAVTLPDGRTAYTRDGAFQRDANNQIVTGSGFRLNWTGQLPAPDTFDAIAIETDGTVRVRQNNQWNSVGRIPTYRFPNPTALQGFGQNAWLATDPSGAAQAGTAGANGYGTLIGQTLEGSNVNMAEEMTHLISLQRAYSLSVRAFQQTDQMFGLAIALRR
jgi:flagellar basal-body rod protein FlgG